MYDVILLLIRWNYLAHWRLNEIARDPPLIPWSFFWIFQSERKHKNKPYVHCNHRHKIGFQDVVYSKSKWMKGQNIQKYRQKDLNLMCKTDKKARNYIISLPCNKMSNRRQENWICKNELTIDLKCLWSENFFDIIWNTQFQNFGCLR